MAHNYAFFRDLCIRISNRYKQYLEERKHQRIQELKALIEDKFKSLYEQGVYPSRRKMEFADISLKTARTCSPELCQEVVKRYSEYLARKKHVRKEKIITESIIEELHELGVYSKMDTVQNKLSSAYIFFKEEYRDVWKNKVEPLGIKI